jgi:hypothetical protein
MQHLITRPLLALDTLQLIQHLLTHGSGQWMQFFLIHGPNPCAGVQPFTHTT